MLKKGSPIRVTDVVVLPFGLKIEGILPFEYSQDEDFEAFFLLTHNGNYHVTSVTYHLGKRDIYNTEDYAIFKPVFTALEQIANEQKPTENQ